MTLDFVVGAFIVRAGRVLLVDHRKLDLWLPVGGHIDPGEDPEEALHREVREETGLEVEIVGRRPKAKEPGARPLILPAFMDRHDISKDHQHVGLFYICRPLDDREPVLSAREHHAIRWFANGDMTDPRLSPSTRFYASMAILEASA